MTSYCPAPGPVAASPANNNYEPGFTVAMMLKDLRLAQDAADGASANIAFGKQAEQLYAQLDQEGLTGKDFSVVMRHIKNG